MTAQKLTKHSWRTEEPLMSADMTAIGTTINKLIDDVNGIIPQSDVTREDIQEAIDQYDQLLKDADSWLTSLLTDTINRVSDLEDGHINIDANNETIKGLKQGLYLTFVALGLGEMDENGNFTVSSATVATTSQLDALNQLVGALQTTSTNTQSQVGLIASWYEKITDDQGNETWVPKYDGAKIMATINNQGLSAAQIIADLINLDGYVKASDIEAGNITVTGDLRYNKLIGNVTEAVGNVTLGDGAYFVDIKQPESDEEAVNLTMPLEPVKGLVIYIMNMERADSIRANVPMIIYCVTRDQDNAPSLSQEFVSANTPINPAQREMGNQVTQFLFDGSKWVQLNAPFISYNITRP